MGIAGLYVSGGLCCFRCTSSKSYSAWRTQYHTRFRSGVARIYVCSAVYVTHYYRTPVNCMLPRSIDYPIVLEETS